VHGVLFVVIELCLVVFCSLLELGFCLGCVESLPLPKGTETCLVEVILLFALCLAFDRLLKFICSCLFFLLFSLVTKCVCCQFTHQGGY
jgi:hypothetical protein